MCLHLISKLYVFHSFCEKYFYTKFHTTAFCFLKVILKERLPYYGNTASLLDSLSMAGSFDFVLLLYHPSFGMIHMNFFDLCLTWLYFEVLLSCGFFCSLLCVCRHGQSKDIFLKALFSYLSHDVCFGCFQIVDGSESSC